MLEHDLLRIQNRSCAQKNCQIITEWQQTCDHIVDLRTHTLESLHKIPRIRRIITPEANYNLLFGLYSDPKLDDLTVFQALLDKYHLSLVPGSAFGIDPQLLYFRLTYATPDIVLEQGLEAIRQFTAEC